MHLPGAPPRPRPWPICAPRSAHPGAPTLTGHRQRHLARLPPGASRCRHSASTIRNPQLTSERPCRASLRDPSTAKKHGPRLENLRHNPRLQPTCHRIALRNLNNVIQRPPLRRLKRLLPAAQPHIRPPLPDKRRHHNRPQRYSQGNMHRFISPVRPGGSQRWLARSSHPSTAYTPRCAGS